jgi:hypothetical protein
MVFLNRTEETMDKAELRPLIFEILRHESQTHLNAVVFQVRSLAENYERHDALKIHEIIWELLVQGVLAPGKNSLNLTLPFFHVTEYGEECLETDTLLLHDPDGYVCYLEETVAAPLDEIVRTYACESQRTFLAGSYLGAMVLLAGAAERAIDLAIEAYLDALPDPQSRAACEEELSLAGWNTKRFYETLKRYFMTLPLPENLHQELDLQLDGLFSLIRASRTDAGKPRKVNVDRATARASLLLFPQQARTIAHLIAHLSTQRS